MPKMSKLRIFVTGGHLTPALSLLEQIKQEKLPWEIIFVGRKTAIEGSKQISEEYRVIQERKLKFLPLFTGRLERTLNLWTIYSLLKIPFGFLQAFYFVLRYRPKLIVSFGGYLALPVGLSGFLLGIPVITHEQTKRQGLANRLINKFAKVCLTIPLFRQAILKAKNSPTLLIKGLPIIYITGGVTGAFSLNKIIFSILPDLLTKYQLVHQVGRDNQASAGQIKQSLPPKLQVNYQLYPYLDSDQHAEILKAAHLVICRTGANTIQEIALLGKVAILIPLPWSAEGEQKLNAQWLVESGSGVILDQNVLTGQKLVTTVKEVESNYQAMSKSANLLQQKVASDGVKQLLKVIKQCLGLS